MWSVRILSGPQTGQIFDLKLGKNVFGRGANCDVKILSVGISKEHCEIHVYKDKAMIVDLKSSNGTFVNGVKIQHSIVKLGDKLSLFDVIMDVIPAPDLRPKVTVPQVSRSARTQQSVATFNHGSAKQIAFQAEASQFPQTQMQQSLDPSASVTQAPSESIVPLKDKIENYIENVVMASIYKLSSVLPFKQVLLGFILLLVLMVTLLSLSPLTTITKESNFQEASKRAKSVARALARLNETALAADQFAGLNVAEALKEDGITEALIVSQADGSIVAPSEIAGRESAKPLISQIRKEQRSMVARIDSKTIGASQPIGTYDLATGETKIKFHAVVYYDVSSLNVDDGRVISLFMQTLVIASILGSILYFIFSRLIQYPISSLNKQIDTALREKTDRAEVFVDYPVFQQLVGNVNLMLNRLAHSTESMDSAKPKQNRDIEFANMVKMLNQPGLVVSQQNIIIAVNHQFEQLSQMSKDMLLNQNYSSITDAALMQNIEALISRAGASPFERHFDRIPFSQYECEISIQACLGSDGLLEYYFIVLNRIEEKS
ncbi:MAG: FHA domain-containing protein [Moraxellaceae bacterium]|nr:FHA domain-containing protein [Pseudobdellovibrionaceae bacterium]